MKNIVKYLFGFTFVLIASTAWSETTHVSVTLSLPHDFIEATCPVPVWKGTTVLWKGLTDARPVSEIGRQTKRKGKDVIIVDSSPPLATFLEMPMKWLLSACGMKFISQGKAAVTLSGEIREFHAGVEKHLFTGKGIARSSLLFHVNRRNDSTERTVEVGYEMEAKEIRHRNIKQLRETLNDLLARTLEQIPKLDGFRDF